MSTENEDKLNLILKKLDRVIELLQTNPPRGVATKARPQKEKLPPLTNEEIAAYQKDFDRLFSSWESGNEVEVQTELDKMDVEEIRRFADANNLNVTAKMPKLKVLQLISGRFRERRQLTRAHFRRDQS